MLEADGVIEWTLMGRAFYREYLILRGEGVLGSCRA